MIVFKNCLSKTHLHSELTVIEFHVKIGVQYKQMTNAV